MATETVKRCDVLRTIGDDVKTVRVIICDMKGASETEERDLELKIDLCPKAIDRLKRFITRGTTPPNAWKS